MYHHYLGLVVPMYVRSILLWPSRRAQAAHKSYCQQHHLCAIVLLKCRMTYVCLQTTLLAFR